MHNVLILSGMNNHNWKLTTPFIKNILESADFKVDITESVSDYLTDADNIAAYDLFVMEYNGDKWCDSNGEAEQNFIDKIKSGCGLVALHGASNWGMKFPEYEKMLGYNWINGESGHGNFHEFKVIFKDKEHPILKNMEEFNIKDELYHKMTIKHDVKLNVIAEAYSAVETRGTGKFEPMIITTEYGSGRCVHNTLGHVWDDGNMISVENKSYQKLLINCCLWAVRQI